MKTRQKLKEAYQAEFTATIERAEKQIILAKHGRRLLELLDDSPVVPGDTRTAYEHGSQARQILNDAEDDLRDWQPEGEEFSEVGAVGAGTTRSAEASTLEESKAGQAAPIDSRPAEAAGALPVEGSTKTEQIA